MQDRERRELAQLMGAEIDERQPDEEAGTQPLTIAEAGGGITGQGSPLAAAGFNVRTMEVE